MCRALTARQAASLLRPGRLYASRRRAGWLAAALGRGFGESDSDALSDTSSAACVPLTSGRLGSLGPSHPGSGPGSQRASDTDGTGAARPGSDAGSSVLGGVTAGPPRRQGGC